MSAKYQIVADENMPGIDSLFGDIADITNVNGAEISNQLLRNADALLCRSITPVNQALLENTRVKFVGTATIGIDHLDTEWLEANSVHWANAAGCNAAAVAQYVLSAISFWCIKQHKQLTQLTIGILGAGNVGSELARCLRALGVNYKLCDPPLAEQGDVRAFVAQQELFKCDVISLHVPLNKTGKHSTYHLFSEQQLAQLKPNSLLINASRGAVIDNQALLNFLSPTQSVQAILDVFEHEPNISQQLAAKCLLSTPHIAGHTLEGKLRGSWMIYQAFCAAFAEKNQSNESSLYPKANSFNRQGNSLEQALLELYDIQLESDKLKKVRANQLAEEFKKLRKNASVLPNGVIRRDYSGWDLPKDLASLG